MLSTRQKLDKLLSDYQHAERSVEEERAARKKAALYFQAVERGRSFIQETAEKIQNTAHQQLASVVTKCLQTIFGEDACEFRINFVQRRGRTEADLVFVKNGKEMDPLTSSGGGEVDIASFALRLACLTLTYPQPRRVLILDEPFKWVSAGYVPAVRKMMLSLAQELNMQFIIVTHIEGLKCGKIVEIGG